jgi:hypothetical protein
MHEARNVAAAPPHDDGGRRHPIEVGGRRARLRSPRRDGRLIAETAAPRTSPIPATGRSVV